MKREQAKQLLPVIQAYAEGKDIQCRIKGDPTDRWTPSIDPAWNPDWEYRIKPREPREFWLCVNKGQPIHHEHLSKPVFCEVKQSSLGSGREQIHFREIIEEEAQS